MMRFVVHIPAVYHGTVEAVSRRDVTLAASKRWPNWRRIPGSRVSRVRFTKCIVREREWRRGWYQRQRNPIYD